MVAILQKRSSVEDFGTEFGVNNFGRRIGYFAHYASAESVEAESQTPDEAFLGGVRWFTKHNHLELLF